jgi:hypothetical protein
MEWFQIAYRPVLNIVGSNRYRAPSVFVVELVELYNFVPFGRVISQRAEPKFASLDGVGGKQRRRTMIEVQLP